MIISGFFILSYFLFSPYAFPIEEKKCIHVFSSNSWRSYEGAKDLVRSLGITTQMQFIEWRSSGERPKDFPSNPQIVYKNHWENWGNFLGTGNTHKKNFRNYRSARDLVRSLGITTNEQFIEWSSSGERPGDFPSKPQVVYKNQWESWGNFLGTENTHKKNFRSYRSARDLVRSLGITTNKQFREWSSSDERPGDFPSRPQVVYKNQWENWGNFFGTGNTHKKNFRSYRSARDLVRSLGITTRRQFIEWSSSGERPGDFPSKPQVVYKNQWENWGNFLGTGNTRKKNFRSYESARDLVRSLGITTQRQFMEWSSSGERPEDFPYNLQIAYKNQWENWGNFLGTGGNTHKKNFRSYRSARDLVRSLGITTQRQFIEWSSSGERPKNFPSNPPAVYKNDWESWGDFFGNEKIKKWMSYRKAKKYVRENGVKTISELIQWLKSNKRPEDFPPNPDVVYGKLWKSAGDFLGIQWMPFEEARLYVQFLSIDSREEYFEVRRSEGIENELPPNPKKVYESSWNGWDDFLFGHLYAGD